MILSFNLITSYVGGLSSVFTICWPLPVRFISFLILCFWLRPFLCEEVSLTFLVMQVWWWWTPAMFACLGNKQYLFNSEWQPWKVEHFLLLFFFYSTVNISCYSPLACKVSSEKSVDSLNKVFLYVTGLSFDVLRFLLIFNYWHIDYNESCVGSIIFGSLWFLELNICFLHQVKKVCSHYFFK